MTPGCGHRCCLGGRLLLWTTVLLALTVRPAASAAAPRCTSYPLQASDAMALRATLSLIAALPEAARVAQQHDVALVPPSSMTSHLDPSRLSWSWPLVGGALAIAPNVTVALAGPAGAKPDGAPHLALTSDGSDRLLTLDADATLRIVDLTLAVM